MSLPDPDPDPEYELLTRKPARRKARRTVMPSNREVSFISPSSSSFLRAVKFQKRWSPETLSDETIAIRPPPRTGESPPQSIPSRAPPIRFDMVCLACLLPLFLVPIVNLLPLLFDIIMAKVYALFGWEYRKPARTPPACPYKPTAPIKDGKVGEGVAPGVPESTGKPPEVVADKKDD
ncbi:uncharacterized protein LOC104439345 [Eucalyptus grandis]|uniref:uncharacterized protein LOC104439345 n=1 Tax=Eucalyptus grandis TaxID=71139 RepID=UPI00192E8080|nr:uncharacterized protein LOC104439345 [Eucalyptus grandis]